MPQFKFAVLTNTPEDVRVQSHEGALMFDGSPNLPLPGQKGISCSVKARDRLRIHYGTGADQSHDPAIKRARKAELIFKDLRTILSDCAEPSVIRDHSLAGLRALGYDPLEEIFKFSFFKNDKNIYNPTVPTLSDLDYFNNHNAQKQANYSLFLLLEKLDEIFGFVNLNWRIQDGFVGLQKALVKNGPIIFVGKYGAIFYGKNDVVLFNRESSTERSVFFFRQNTISPIHRTHCVIVEEAKIIDGKPFVFFQDPQDASIPNACKRPVYLLSYDNFVKRIADKYGETASCTTPLGLVMPSGK